MQATSSRSSARPLLLSVFFWVGLVLVVGIVLPGYLFWLEGEAGKTATPASFAVALMAGVVWTWFPLPATFFRRYTLVFFVVAGCLAPVTFLAFLYNSLEYNPHAPYSSGLYLLGFCLGYLSAERLCRPMPLKSGHWRGLAVLFLLPGLWLGGTYAGVRYIEGEMAASEAYFMAVSCDPQAPPSAGENLYTVFGDRCYSPWDAETSALHPPLADVLESGDARKNIRLLLSREGSCLKVGEYGPYSDMISAVYYVEAPPFDIRGMAASNRFPRGETQDVHLEDGTVLRHIRNAKALGAIPFGALDNQMTWRRIHGNYYYINGFRGGSVIEDGIFTEKNHLDLRPYLGEGTHELKLAACSGVVGKGGNIPFTLWLPEEKREQEIVLTPVAREDLPEDFPFEQVRWMTEKSREE